MPDILKSIIYGIVEGITEWLPVSSTGHMILLSELLPLDVSDDFFNLFLVVIQLGAILAVVIRLWGELWPFAKPSRNTDPAGKGVLSICVRTRWRTWGRIFIACIPAAIVGVLFDDYLDELFYNSTVVSIMLILFGIAFIVVESLHIKPAKGCEGVDDITVWQALIIGLWQVIAAVFPGTSRSGATIVGGLLMGMPRPVVTEFTFLLAVPVMLGASLFKIVKFGLHFSSNEIAILCVGMIVAFAVSMLVIRFILGYVRKHTFKAFGYYRIVLGVCVLLYFAFR